MNAAGKSSGLKPPSKTAKPSGLPKLSAAGGAAANNSRATSSISEVPEPGSPSPAPADLPSFSMGRRHSEDITRRPSANSLGNGLRAGRRHSENPDMSRKKMSDGGSSTVDPLWLQARRLSEAGVRRMSDASVILTEDTDDFIIGDKVWVGGTKPGQIAYIGETQFAPGEWAGVVLDDPIGKNDGSVAGVRYFMCEPKRGVFSRLTKLTRSPLDKPPGDGVDADRANGSQVTSKTLAATPARKVTPLAINQDSTLQDGSAKDVRKSPSPAPAVPSSSGPLSGELKVGDRVIVMSSTGTKVGVLRYTGATDFAAGEWAGVELHDPLGKNDGSVAGKRYFQCKPNYGLFAPIHKVSQSPASRRTSAVASHRPSVGSVSGIHRQGSKDSISSMSSTTSVGRTSRKSPRPSATSLVATHNALQEALKEKEQHIEQLLKERDLERAEVARAASQVDDAEQKLATLKQEFDQHKAASSTSILDWQQVVTVEKKEKEELRAQLEEERRKIEDLQFQVEEATISKGELESQTDSSADRIQQLEQLLAEERQRAEILEKESDKGFEREELLASYKDEIETYKSELDKARMKLSDLEKGNEKQSVSVQEKSSELTEKTSRVRELETLLSEKEKEMSELKKEVNCLCREVEKRKKDQERNEEETEALTRKLSARESSVSSLSVDLQKLQIEKGDLQRQLEAMEGKCDQLVQQKQKLESDIVGMMSTSSDSSTQLAKLNSDLRTKEYEQEALQAQLMVATQEVQKMKQILSQAQEQHRQEQQQTGDSYNEELSAVTRRLQATQEDIERANQRLVTEQKKHGEELVELARRKEVEMHELQQEKSHQEVQATHWQSKAHELEKQLMAANTERSQVIGGNEKKLDEVTREIGRLNKDNQELLKCKVECQDTIMKLESENQRLQKVWEEKTQAVEDREQKLRQLAQEVERLKETFGLHKAELQQKLAETQQDAAAVEEMHRQLTNERTRVDELQVRLSDMEMERTCLQEEVLVLHKVRKEKEELEQRSSRLQREVEELKQRETQFSIDHENEKDSLQKLLESTQIVLEQNKKEVERQVSELNTLRVENVQVNKFRNLNASLEREKLNLENKVVEVQVALAQAQANANANADPSFKKLIEENESTHSQIAFLNAIIVDMQKKNDDLRSKLEIMETSESFRDNSDLNLNGIKPRVVAPRLFCDICDMFDLHDTEDCPQQAMSDSPTNSNTQYHGQRGQERPYCEICEVFGHWTANCDDAETF